MSHAIPVRPSRYPGEFMVSFRRDPRGFMRDAAARYGDVVALRGGREPIVLVNHPDLIRDVLVTHAKSFKKGRALENARRFLGDGLLTSEGEFHRRQRRMIQPAFHRRRIEGYACTAEEIARQAASEWREAQEVDALAEMMRVTLQIVTQTLFGAAMEQHAVEIRESLTTLVEQFRFMMLPGAALLERLPLPSMKRLRAAQESLHALTASIIASRRSAFDRGEADESDLLGMLLASQDEEDESGARMTDQQIHDEVLTLFIAGHETTSVWLTWTWYLLAVNPPAEEKLQAELKEALDGKPAGFDDLPRLPYTRQILLESLRLYPPAWAVGRRALADVSIGEFELKAGSLVILSPAVMQSDARYWDRPAEFLPERWADETVNEARPKFAFFPFGGGPRTCIGEQFAWMEATIVLANLASSWRLRRQPGAKDPAPQPLVTMRPKDGMPMMVERVG